MTKMEIAAIIADNAEITKIQAELVLSGLLEIIESELIVGQKVSFTGFGTFEVAERKARVGRNPRTGEEINILASKTPKFRAGKTLKEAVAK